MFGKMSIKAQLRLVVVVVSALSLGMAMLGFVMLSNMSSHINNISSSGLKGDKLLSQANNAIWELRFGIANYTLADPAARKKILDGRPKLYSLVEKSMKEYASLEVTAEQRGVLKEFSGFYTEYKSGAPKWFELIDAGKLAEAADYRSKVTNAAASEMVKHLQSLLEMQVKSAEALTKTAESASWSAKVQVLAIGAALILAAGMLLLFISRSIIKSIDNVTRTAERIADGDLTAQVTCNSSGEMGQLVDAFGSMTEKLRNTIGQVADTSIRLSEASHRLHATAGEIAGGAEAIVSQAQTVATAGEEMAATANDIAANCQNAAIGAQDASGCASEGSRVVEKTVQTMEQITEQVHQTATTVLSLGDRSDQIGQIVGTIEDIADQTNLLALNAAIEAARAGEQGRGFAVVADEVRALAERTTKATREIGEMIRVIQGETRSAVAAMETGVREVEKGSSEAAKSGEALSRIMERINVVSLQVGQVATAAEEQTAATGEISDNMRQITDVIQQMAKGAQQSAGEASLLSEMAVNLQAQVGKFRI